MACETALWAHANLLECVLLGLTCAFGDEVCGLVHTRNHLVLVFEGGKFRSDDAEDDVLVLGEVCKRLEAAGARGVVFEVVSVNIQVLR